MKKYIVVHAGARDQYKLAEALYKNGNLGFLVTDDLWLRRKYKKLFPRELVYIPFASALFSIFLKLHNFGDKARQFNNYLLGKAAGQLSKKNNMPLLALQEYAFHAYQYSDIHPRVVFQYHPQASSCKRIFEEEMKRNVETSTYQKELAIYTPKKIYEANQELAETDFYIAASTFTKRTIEENNGVDKKVFVAPYGVDVTRYPFKERHVPTRITFLFVGAFVERKGIQYLMKAAKRLEEEGYDYDLQLTGRASFEMSMFDKFNLKNLHVHSNLSHEELIELYHNSDVFVFPSLFEGFAFVIIEAMATGLPVITTDRTVGPDVITEGEEGFVIEPSNSDAIYEKMKYFILNPDKCPMMGKKATLSARSLTWDNFEKRIIDSLEQIEIQNK